MDAKKIKWTVWSGEGEEGLSEEVMATDKGIRRIVTKERCLGDRWAWAAPSDDPQSKSSVQARDWWHNYMES